MLRQVKQKLRGLPEKGLSYGAIKYLVPDSDEVEVIKGHRRHNLSFNYMGKFQEVGASKSMFSIAKGIDLPQMASDE
ncbi:unnamed protein product, partial [Aphanomyces euteiches]